MHHKFTLLLLITGLVFSCSSLKYDAIEIPAGQEFVLGEMAKKSYSVYVKNPHAFPLLVEIRYAKTGKVSQKTILPPRGSRKFTMAQTEEIHFPNNGRLPITTKVALKEGVDGMEYRPLGG
jgi:hypothetical protein